MSRRTSSPAVRVALVSLFVLLGLLAMPTSPASAHVERPSYWPDPKADCEVKPCAGGKVPKARSLASSLDRSRRGDTRVVCKRDSLERVRASVKHARKHGYDIRPTDHRKLSAKKARTLLRVNKQLFERCAFHQIQRAVTASGNNDRVVVMPGLYTERHSRRQPTFDKACKKYTTPSDSGDPGALSHDYQIHCPNDANLVAVIGRGPDTAPVPAPPRSDRHGIPGVGSCIRCNFQLEGSGVSADDVIVEAGDASKGNGGPSAAGHKKDVGIFVDRADGFVLRNMTVRHAREHNIYVIETDGYRLDRFKVFYGGGYGVLTFVGDHGLVQNCDAAGSGDSGLYPGSGADSTTAKRYKPFYPEERFSQVVPQVRQPPQHRRVLGHQQPRHPDHQEQLLRQRARLHHRRVHRAGSPGLPAGRQRHPGQQLLRQQLQPLRARVGRRPVHPRPGRHRPVAGGRQRQRGRRQPLLRQLAPRADAVRRPRRHRVRPAAGRQRHSGPGLRPGGDLDVVRQQDPRQHDGRLAHRQGPAQRPRLLVGQLPGHHRQLLVGQQGRARQVRDDVAVAPAELRRRHPARHQHRCRGRGQRGRAGRLPGGLRGVRLPERQQRDLHLERHARQAGQRPGRDATRPRRQPRRPSSRPSAPTGCRRGCAARSPAWRGCSP